MCNEILLQVSKRNNNERIDVRLNYLQISQQLMPYVERYNKKNPESTTLQEVVSNTYVYQTPGEFVTILQALAGAKTGKEYERFDVLCQHYQTAKLKDIPLEDANELWDEFRMLMNVQAQ